MTPSRLHLIIGKLHDSFKITLNYWKTPSLLQDYIQLLENSMTSSSFKITFNYWKTPWLLQDYIQLLENSMTPSRLHSIIGKLHDSFKITFNNSITRF